MFITAGLAIIFAFIIAVIRALRGPTVFDRLLAANSIGTAAILLLAVLGFITGRPEFLDIGITYSLLNLIGTLAVLKFIRYGDLGHSGKEEVAET
ncbi:MAG TPA: pH regulation protein F [Rhizobiales bacterium]|nr:pH regulation protein F [Hyphomicrobiales bacterium]